MHIYLTIYVCLYLYLYHISIFVWRYYDSKHVLYYCMCAQHMDICTCNVILFVSFYICWYTCRIFICTQSCIPHILRHIHIVGMYALYVHIYDHTSVETSGYCTVLKTNTEDSSRFSDSLASLCRFRAGQRTSGLVSTSLTLGPVVDGQNPAQIGVF